MPGWYAIIYHYGTGRSHLAVDHHRFRGGDGRLSLFQPGACGQADKPAGAQGSGKGDENLLHHSHRVVGDRWVGRILRDIVAGAERRGVTGARFYAIGALIADMKVFNQDFFIRPNWILLTGSVVTP